MGRGKGRYNKDCERVRQEKKEKKRKIRKPNSNTTKRKVNW